MQPLRSYLLSHMQTKIINTISSPKFIQVFYPMTMTNQMKKTRFLLTPCVYAWILPLSYFLAMPKNNSSHLTKYLFINTKKKSSFSVLSFNIRISPKKNRYLFLILPPPNTSSSLRKVKFPVQCHSLQTMSL